MAKALTQLLTRSRLYFIMAAGSLLLGGLLFGQGLYIYVKAEVAQLLLKNAWQETQRTQHTVKPWPWADTWPVARMLIPSQHVDLIVLAGDTGRTLAFGPGHRFGTVLPGQSGNSIISAHRDMHFKFIRNLVTGDEIIVENSLGLRKRFVVNSTDILDSRTTKLAIDYDQAVLTLITCYPFDAITPGGPLRFIVFATESDGFIEGVLI